jgi:hypothetical protein
MCQNGKNLGFCCGFCEISTAGADLLIRNGTGLRVGPEGSDGKAHVVWIGVEMWERGQGSRRAPGIAMPQKRGEGQTGV